MNNPLLHLQGLPPFSQIKPEHVEPAIDQILADNRTLTTKLLADGSPYSWENLIEPLEIAADRLARSWSPVSHMNAVVNSKELRLAYNACLPKLSEYSTEMGQNEQLFKAYQEVAESSEALDEAQQQSLKNALLDFHLSGVDLPADKKQRYKEIDQELSSLTSKFEENLLDATNAWSKLIQDERELAGMPQSALDLAHQTAEQQDQDGWLLTLEFPSYMPVMTYCDNRELRKEMYTAFVTRASENGPHAGQWDNSGIMEQLLQLRHEAAQILGFDNYAELSLAKKMAPSSDTVMEFLLDLAEQAHPQAKRELAELQEFAATEQATPQLEAWDIGYYSEKLRQQRYAITQEELKPYFPETHVIPGMFTTVQRLFDVEIREIEGIDSWHPTVRFFEILDQSGELSGQFYLDLYARPHKRGGAWMDECITRMVTDTQSQAPVAYLNCNFSPPVGGKPALFTHEEVLTLFHEFGHGLHHMLTRIDYPAVSGISGVAWDAVELPSQFLENWCWQQEALELICGHWETREPLPEQLYQRMQAARNFQSAMQMVRQLEFSIFDFRLHREYDPTQGGRIYPLLEQIREQVAVIRPPEFNRFAHGFAHIFAGGYTAGYYSYKWAELLSADAFSLFEEQGVFNKETGRSFLHNILEMGGSRDAMKLFIAFRGREPEIDALLRHSGITTSRN